MPAKKSFVGFGFGPIQSALFLFEAYRSGNFDRYAVAEVDAALVKAVRDNGGRYTVNIAHADRIEQVTVEGVELYNPGVEADLAKLIDAVAHADELATALPSVKFFATGGKTSVVSVLSQGLAQRDAAKPGLIYAAENHNHAAEILTEELHKAAGEGVLKNVQVLNTVIGKMSGVITDAQEIKSLKLATLTPNTPRAVLVEAFNRILISKATLPGYQRGISILVEKPDLLPFEEAKLYGHNAIHALIGYLSQRKGLGVMAEAAGHPDILATARKAFIDESGAALIKKYAALKEELFTPAGYRAYAEDLLVRMVNPNLNDLVARVIRDPVRKLGYEDRLYGTMRVALSQGVEPANMAQGAAAAVLYMIEHRDQLPATPGVPANLPASREQLTQDSLARLLREIWGQKTDQFASGLIDLTWKALQKQA